MYFKNTMGKKDEVHPDIDTFSKFKKFLTSSWGLAHNIAMITCPVNLGLHYGDIDFIPIYGDAELSTGLAMFLTTILVYTMFTIRHEIFYKWLQSRFLFRLRIFILFMMGTLLLVVYFIDQPQHAIGAILYAGIFMAFTATFHMQVIKNFVYYYHPMPEKLILEEGKAKVRHDIGIKIKVAFEFQRKDRDKWIYNVYECKHPENKYKATIYRKRIEPELDRIANKKR